MGPLARFGSRIPRIVMTIAALVVVIALLAGGLMIWSRLTRVLSSVLSSPACPAPCWSGIQPGKTTVGEVLTFLPEQPFVQGASVHVWPASGPINQIAWKFQRPVGDVAGYAYFESEQCTAVTILTTGSLTLAEALSKFGRPQLLFTQTGKADARAWVEVDLVYPATGYLVEADIDAPDKSAKPQVTIDNQTPVMRVTYFDPQRFQALLSDNTLINGPAGLSQSDMRPWSGLGTIDFSQP